MEHISMLGGHSRGSSRGDHSGGPLGSILRMIHPPKWNTPVGFRVWEKMRDVVQYCPVVLDPNTAHSDLQLSEDLTSVCVMHKNNHLDLPDNPERFSEYPIVLGSQGFSSGTHSWDVEVGDHPRGRLGVVKETVDRKDERTPSSEKRFWDLVNFNNHYFTSAGETLNLKNRPQKIHVMFDYSRGTVSFYDCIDRTHIHTHRTRFTEKLLPFITIGLAPEAKTKDIRICPSHL